MVDLLVSKILSEITIQSHRGPYSVHFVDDAFNSLEALITEKSFLIIDKNFSQIYFENLKHIRARSKYLILEANEANKDLNCFSQYIKALAELGIKRDCTLIAIGGGVIQDITCFIATTLFRGINWVFFPTTLLAQTDSCIGSKSSINVAGIKNLLGTFTPPSEIFISVKLLKSLEPREVQSGVGEMIKVHGIAGISKLKALSADYSKIVSNDEVMAAYIQSSLLIKKEIIEQDEFDNGIRNVMNYGHTFGHAIESSTNYGIAHGIAVTIGVAMASEYSCRQGYISKDHNDLMQDLFLKNQSDSLNFSIDFPIFMKAILADKKNVGTKVAIIIPTNNDFKVEKRLVDANESFRGFCRGFFIAQGFKINE